ncbi:YdcH family protein [Paenirhodobacter enshiensis]|uniref:YdcH family protein n=1 Tax=Paenirhodobacter enshiensis TaxID=1105367 RepID=UPI0035B3C683
MSMTSHITELRRKHEVLSDQVNRALKSPGADALTIAALKREKLRIKDQISRLEQPAAAM